MHKDSNYTNPFSFFFILKIAAIFALIFVLQFMAPPETHAQDDGVVRTVFCIGNINAIFNYPINVFTVNGDELILAETWRAQIHGIGPVGMAVDPIAEHLYVTYESEGFVDAFDARDGTLLGSIQLAGTSNLAGIDVRVGDGLLYVVDRGQTTLWVFDSDTFLPVENWPLTGLGGFGAYDLEVVEDWDGRDVIFVSNGFPDVHYYDLDTHEHFGQYIMSNNAASVTVDNSSGTPVLFAAATSNGTPGGHSFLLKYDVATGTTDQVNLGSGDGRGVGVNPVENLVYINVSGVPNAIRVYDQDTLTELHRYNLPGSPTDTESSQLAFGSTVKKEIINASANPINGANEFDAGEEIVFEITLTNKRVVDIHFLPLTDIYDITQLTWISSTMDPVDSNDDGELDWTDMITFIGHDLAFEEEFTFEVTFLAEPDQCERYINGTNIMQMHDAVDAGGDAVNDSSGSTDYKIWCTCVTDEDCDDGIFCNGPEICDNRQCLHSGNPCPVDDGLFCNGLETDQCIEETQDCSHAGDPCPDDTICNETTDSCDPAGDDDADDDIDDDVDDDDLNDDADDDADDDINNDSDDDISNDDDVDNADDDNDDVDDTGGSCCG